MENKKINWYSISFIAFTSMWSINNIFNNFAQQGLHALFSWIFIILLYFIPYLFIVSKLGAAFPNSDGGVSTWVERTIGSKMAYLASWAYWIVNLTYLAQKPQNILVSLAWIFSGSAKTINSFSPSTLAFISFIILMILMWFSARGINTLKVVGSIAGIGLLISSALMILLAFTTLFILHLPAASPHLNNPRSYLPTFNSSYLSTLSMLIFAVGGAEKISPYINNLKNGRKNFPKSMLLLAFLVGGSAILGTYSLGILFNSHAIPKDLMMNGAYVAFNKLGKIFHLGSTLMILYAISNFLSQIAALIVSIDAPIRILFSENNRSFIPNVMMRRNSNNVPIIGYLLTGGLTSILIFIPTLKIHNVANFYNWLLNLNSVVIPFKFLFIFLAFIFLIKKLPLSLNKKAPQILLGVWIFAVTLVISLMGMIPKNVNPFTSEWWFQLVLNVATPVVFGLLGVILPLIKRKD